MTVLIAIGAASVILLLTLAVTLPVAAAAGWFD